MKDGIFAMICQNAFDRAVYDGVRKVKALNNAYRTLRNAGVKCDKPETLKMTDKEIRERIEDAMRQEAKEFIEAPRRSGEYDEP